MLPSHVDLTYFIEVSKHLNLSRTATNLGISQPSLTLAMQRLEMSLDTSLFIRHKRGVSLTKAGKQLLIKASELLRQWEGIKAESYSSAHDIQGNFRLGCHASMGLYVLPKLLADLLQNNPKLEIELHHGVSRNITAKVINLDIDIGIVVNPIRHPNLVIQQLEKDRVHLWCNESKSLKLNSGIDLYSQKNILLCDPDLIQTQAILKALKKSKISYGRIITSSSLEVIAELTKSGCGIGILPSTIALPKNLIAIPNTPYYEDEICLIYHGDNRNMRAIQIINDAIKLAFKKNRKSPK
jgi:LysR family transcriptional regulator, cell division regulator